MFCRKCGGEIVPGAAFCAKCGNPVDPSPVATGSAATASVFTVTFVRESQWFAFNPAVKIVVDERDEYRIDNGQTVRVPMTRGTHSIDFKCGIRNKIIDLTVEGDIELHLKWNRVTGSLTVRQ